MLRAMGTGVSDSRVWYRRLGLTTVSVVFSLRMLSIVVVILGAAVVTPEGSHAALAVSNDQADETAPNGAPLSAETQRLFQAVRDGDLGSVQQAVLDGADIVALNADATTAADLAESLGHFTITLFLRAYQAIEGYDAAPTTVVETEEPGPVTPPAAIAPRADALSSTPISGQGIVPAGETEEPPSGGILETSSQTASAISLQTIQVSEMPDEEPQALQSPQEPQVIQMSQEPQAAEPSGDYFSRLSMLNPTHEPIGPEQVAPTGQVIEGGNGLQSLTAIGEASTEATQFSENVTSAVTEPASNASGPSDEALVQRDVIMAFVPFVPPRKPVEDMTGEASIFAVVEQEQPVSETILPGDRVAEVDAPMLAEVPVPEFSQPAATEEPGKGSFFARMRVFDEGSSDAMSTQPGITTESLGSARNTEMVPQFEQIRAAVIEKLRRESNERSRQLADVRDENLKVLETEDMVREHLSGSMNIQTELRAKQRTTVTGTALPPGYAPPPDGGTSGIRFLQRLGLYAGNEPALTIEAEASHDTGLPSGSSSYDQPILTEAGENLLIPVLSPAKLAKKSMAFIDYGYSAPPAGRTIDTAEDNAVAALSQIARLFQSPDIGYPSLTSALPAPGTLPQTPTNAPLNSSDMAIPPPMSSASNTYGMEVATPDVMVLEIPVGQAELAQVGDPFQPALSQPVPGWDVTATDSQGNMVAALPPSANGNIGDGTGLTTQLSRMFDPVDTGAAVPGRVESANALFGSNTARLPIKEATGSWDVVSVQAAPTAARTLLGGAVVPKTSAAVSGAGALSMGQSVVLGKAPPIGVDPTARKKACIDKRRGAILFCIEHIDWPTELQSIMQVDTVMYQGLNAIVRYDNGIATRFHALFPSESFNTIVSYYMQRLGNPTNVWRRTISPLAAPDRENPTVSWQALNPHTQMTSTLEIRQFDDTRGGFPDEKRGAVTLYSAQSGPIFPQVSAFELMRLHPGS